MCSNIMYEADIFHVLKDYLSKIPAVEGAMG